MISYIIEDWSFLKGIYLHALPCLSDLVVFIRIKCKYFSNCASPKGPTPSPINNSHYYIYVLHFQLIISNIEPNPGPLTNNLKTKNISIVHNNVCSLLHKIDVVYNELSDHDIIAISETHLDNSIPDNDITFHGFHPPIRKDRNRFGGGLLFYISLNLHFILRNDLNNDNIELIWCEIHAQENKKNLLGLIYRPPNSNASYYDYLSLSIESALNENMPVFLISDFNIDMLANGNNTFKQLMIRYNLLNLVNEPTNFTSTPGTCIDLIFTNNDSIVDKVSVTTPICSTHSPVSFDITYNTFKQYAYKRTIRNYNYANYADISNDINITDWDSTVFNSENINEVYDNFLQTYNNIIDKHIPKKVITIRPRDKPFMNNNIRLKMRQRNRIHKKAKHTDCPDHWQRFKELRNEVISLVRKAKEQYKQKLTSQILDKDIPPGKWWRIVKSISKFSNTHKPIPPLKYQGQILIHPIDKAEALNKFYSKISNIGEDKDIPEHGPGPPDVTIENIFFNEQEVADQLSTLDSSKPPGPDGVTPRILKQINTSISKPLVSLFNKSLKLRCLPNIWKKANVTPVFKGKGDPDMVNNYRPISLTSTICKIMEKIIFKYLFNFMKDNEILTKYQSGFQPNDSTVNQLVEIYNSIISNLDKGKDVRFVFCDISKAFDKVWHKGLLFKLEKYGISGNLLKWLENYLDDRVQRVVLDGFHSSFKPVNAGVPQGSVLGPFLFLLYINDLSENLVNNIRLFADDTSLFVIVDNNINAAALSLTSDLDIINTWANTWAVEFNPNKTFNLNFSRSSRTHPPVHFGNTGNIINESEIHRHLGLLFQADAKWSSHITYVHDKACSRLNLLRMVKHVLDRTTLIKIYFAFIRPILEYASIVWDNCTLENSKLLEDVQVEAARIITGLRRNSSRSNLYIELGWETLSERRQKQKLFLFYKIVYGIAPQYLHELLLPYIPPPHEYNLRNTGNLNFVIPQTRTVSYFNSFLPSSIQLWNALPEQVKCSESFTSFKNKLKKSALEKAKYAKLFNFGNRKENIIHCQLRNESSNLQAHLHSQFLSNSDLCNNCNNSCEDNFHFFSVCPTYNEQRLVLYSALESVLRLNVISPVDLVQIMLYGDRNLSYETNCSIFKAVHQYIKSSKRF